MMYQTDNRQGAEVARLEDYLQAGVDRLVLLRGDRKEGAPYPGPFRHADELVRFVQDRYRDRFSIEVACYPEFHPESPTPRSELAFFKQKVDAGADGVRASREYNEMRLSSLEAFGRGIQ